jgi:hypothetical protein
MEYTGGCQCGAVRFTAKGRRGPASICYCRMCQRASGAPFMAFVRFRVTQIKWSNPPTVFSSSNIVERGFCSACGTPLSYRHINGEHMSLTLHSLDQPHQIQPEMRFSSEAEPAWCRTISNLRQAALEAEMSQDLISYQYDPETW